MQDTELRSFVDYTVNFFHVNFGGEEPQVGVPQIADDGSKILDFTGVIDISGIKKGRIYFTGSRAFFLDIAEIMLRQSKNDVSDEVLKDIAGEIANILSGNAQATFGDAFDISIPLDFSEDDAEIAARRKGPLYLIPLFWKTGRAALLIGFN